MIGNYGELRTAVESAISRTDIPDFVYTLATAELNTRLRLVDMQATTSLSVSAEAANLPTDFMQIVAVYLDSDYRYPLQSASEYAKNASYRSSGAPVTFTVIGGSPKKLLLNPVPDGTYTVFVRYIAKLAEFSADADTNDVLTNYPALYLYAALKHAGIWCQDVEQANTWGAALEAEAERVHRADMLTRYAGGPLVSRAAAAP